MHSLSWLFSHIRSITIASSPQRLSRGQYILSSGLISLYSIAAGLIVAIIVKLTGSVTLFSILSAIVGVVTLVFLFKVTIRRCHDLNISWRRSILLIIPVVNVIFILYLVFAKGTVGDNPHGTDQVPAQDPSDSNYRILGILFIIIYFIISSINGNLTKGVVGRMRGPNSLWGGTYSVSGFQNAGQC